ncbi:MAG: YybS family protein [Clostridiales bacterium]|nr:YybS family protein [Clostridiales bacterium]
MTEFGHKKALTESALIVAMVTFFIIGTLYIPMLYMALIILPVPFILLSTRHGTRYTVISLIVTSFLIGFLAGPIYSIFIFMLSSPLALSMGYSIKKRNKPYEVIGFGTGISTLSIFALIQLISLISGINIINEIAHMVQEVVKHQGDMLTNLDIGVIELKQAINYFMMIVPAMVIIQSMVGAFINYYLTSVIINRFQLADYYLGEFSEFRLPRNIVLGSFIIFILSVFTSYIEGLKHSALILNITSIFLVVFFLQGISLVAYLLKKSKVPRFIRVSSIILLILISPLMTIIAMLGVTDSIIDIRRIRNKE